jgi:hypothetical protein
MQVHFIGDMHEATDLKIILLHILHLILNFECINFWKDARDQSAIMNVFQEDFESYLDTSLMLVLQAQNVQTSHYYKMWM